MNYKMDEMMTQITNKDKIALTSVFGQNPDWEPDEMIKRLEVEMEYFEFERAKNVLKEVWWHWRRNYATQGMKAYKAFYNDVLLFYDTAFHLEHQSRLEQQKC